MYRFLIILFFFISLSSYANNLIYLSPDICTLNDTEWLSFDNPKIISNNVKHYITFSLIIKKSILNEEKSHKISIHLKEKASEIIYTKDLTINKNFEEYHVLNNFWTQYIYKIEINPKNIKQFNFFKIEAKSCTNTLLYKVIFPENPPPYPLYCMQSVDSKFFCFVETEIVDVSNIKFHHIDIKNEKYFKNQENIAVILVLADGFDSHNRGWYGKFWYNQGSKLEQEARNFYKQQTTKNKIYHFTFFSFYEYNLPSGNGRKTVLEPFEQNPETLTVTLNYPITFSSIQTNITDIYYAHKEKTNHAKIENQLQNIINQLVEYSEKNSKNFNKVFIWLDGAQPNADEINKLSYSGKIILFNSDLRYKLPQIEKSNIILINTFENNFPKAFFENIIQ